MITFYPTGARFNLIISPEAPVRASARLIRSETSSFKCVHSSDHRYSVVMETVTSEVTTRELRGNLADVLGRTMYAGERIGVTRNGKLAAVLVSVSDLEALEAFEDAQDVAAYRAAKAQDDGERVSLDELRRDLRP